MCKVVTFEVLGKPYGKGRPRFTKSGMVYTPKETKEHEKIVKAAYQQQTEAEKLDGKIKAKIRAIFPIPKSASKKKQSDMFAGVIRPTTKPDCDNIAKTILDALNKIAYDDDSQVVEITIIKEYGGIAKTIIELEEIR